MPIQKKTTYEAPENAFRGPSGAYIVTLVNITEPREVTSTWDGESRTRKVEEWQFALEDGQMVWDPWVTHFDGDSLSDRATMYGYAAALVGGVANLEERVFPKVDDLADLRRKLIGRQAIATISVNGDGPAKIDNLGAIPPSMLKPQAAPQPVAQPLRQQVDETLDDLPF